MSIYYKRQSDEEAILLYKASTYCYKKEYVLKYITIGFSLFFCFAAIFLNSYLFIALKNMPEMIPDPASLDPENITMILNPRPDELRVLISDLKNINSIIASFYLIISIFLNTKCSSFHREAVHLEELYDNYVYGLKPNVYTTRNISQPVINNYAKKLRQSDLPFKTKYFHQDSNDENMVFDNQKRIIEENYEVLNYSKEKWFIPAWLFIIILIIACSMIVNSGFIDTLQSIFFPSLTAISIIVSSWYSHNCSTSIAHTSLNAINETTEFKSTTNLRNIQDAIFGYRLRSFMMPEFIIAKYRKYNMKRIKKVNRIKFKENFEIAYEEVAKGDSAKRPVKKTAKPVTKTNINKPTKVETAVSETPIKMKKEPTQAETPVKTKKDPVQTASSKKEAPQTVTPKKDPVQSITPKKTATRTKKEE